jgi:hypothetical protein
VAAAAERRETTGDERDLLDRDGPGGIEEAV